MRRKENTNDTQAPAYVQTQVMERTTPFFITTTAT